MERKKRIDLLRELFMFGLVGGSAFVVDAGTLWILNQVFGIYYLIANVVGVAIGIIWTFFGHKYITFRDKGDDYAKQGARFIVVALVGISLQSLVLFIAMDFLSFETYLGESAVLFAKVVAVGVASISNYLFNKFWTFKK